MSDTDFLINLGLTKGESQTYIALLEMGPVTAGPIARRLNMQRSTVYFCLERLLEKGLASFIFRSRQRLFRAASPSHLRQIVSEKKRRLVEQEKNLESLIPKLSSASAPQMPSAFVYEGWRGAETAFMDAYEQCKRGTIGYCFILSDWIGSGDVSRYRRLVARFRAARAKKRIWLKVIAVEKSLLGGDQSDTLYTEVRFIARDVTNPAVFNVYGDRVIMAIWSDPPTAFSIHSKPLASTLKSTFSELWKQAEASKTQV